VDLLNYSQLFIYKLLPLTLTTDRPSMSASVRLYAI